MYRLAIPQTLAIPMTLLTGQDFPEADSGSFLLKPHSAVTVDVNSSLCMGESSALARDRSALLPQPDSPR
jgi:hypothetical protein